MINFNEEIQRFKPSLDVDDIEEAIANMDLTDMNDIMMRLVGNISENNSSNTVNKNSPESPQNNLPANEV